MFIDAKLQEMIITIMVSQRMISRLLHKTLNKSDLILPSRVDRFKIRDAKTEVLSWVRF